MPSRALHDRSLTTCRPFPDSRRPFVPRGGRPPVRWGDAAAPAFPVEGLSGIPIPIRRERARQYRPWTALLVVALVWLAALAGGGVPTEGPEQTPASTEDGQEPGSAASGPADGAAAPRWGNRTDPPGAPASGPGQCTVSALLVPSCGAWTGVAPGAFSDRPKAGALADFESLTGAPTDIVHVYHSAGDLFPTHGELAMTRQDDARRMLMVNYKPQGRHTWAEVADGAVDDELDRLAAHLRRHTTEPFFLTIHHEPENDVDAERGSGFTARDYARMFRHVVDRLRDRGVTTIVSVFNVIGSQEWGTEPWFEDLYPGDRVVDWVAWDPYACVSPENDCGDFASMVNRTYRAEWPGFYDWATTTHPDKPLMIAEWGVFENGDERRKPEFLATVADQLPDFPAIKALLYFDSARAPRGDTRVNSSPAALGAYRELLRDPYFRQAPG